MDHRAILCECAFVPPVHKGFGSICSGLYPIQLQQIKEQINVAAADKGDSEHQQRRFWLISRNFRCPASNIPGLTVKVVIIAFQIPVLGRENA